MIEAAWTRYEGGPGSAVEAGLSVLTSAFLLSPVAFCLLVAIPELALAAAVGHGGGVWMALFAFLAFTPTLCRWTVRQLFELWGERWRFVARDGSRWGEVYTLFGWYGAGAGVCLSGFEATEAGRTPLTSTDALRAGPFAVASSLARIRGGRSQRAVGSFEALMLATIAGLTARGGATISRARETRWRKDWLRQARQAAPELTFTLERRRDLPEDGELERRILGALQAAEDRLAGPVVEEQVESYRRPASTARRVRLRLDGELLGPAFAAAFAALGEPAPGGAPVAVAAAIDDFGTRDPERMTYLCGLLAAHRLR
ncbi:MAG TPA: hypothetical protein VLS89_02545 [Candidatus Nanopelagicales bacterium]|nr:hypothetical protein [Candidatus Nanopelagicales bacterium]